MAETKRNGSKERDISDTARDISDTAKETIGLVKENYFTWFGFSTSLWEENLKTLSSQMDKWLVLQDNYINVMKGFSEKLPTNGGNGGMEKWNVGVKPLIAQMDWFISLQKDYVGFVRNTSDKFTKDLTNLNQKSMQRVFSAFDDYLNLLK